MTEPLWTLQEEINAIEEALHKLILAVGHMHPGQAQPLLDISNELNKKLKAIQEIT